MERRTVLRAAAAVAAVSACGARGQTRARRIGYLSSDNDPGPPPAAVVADWKRLGWTLGDTLIEAARALGLAVPRQLLLRADRVIE